MAGSQTALAFASPGSCVAQPSSSEIFVVPGGGSSILPSQTEVCRRHLGPTGKLCLNLQGSAKPQTINPKIFEHLVTVTNSCGQTIRVKICYHDTESCITVDAPPWGREARVLGIFPALKEFRYDYTEKFK
jgi:hypothetical protein